MEKNAKQATLVENVLLHARWSPSGDNMQTWRFEIIAKDHFVVHGYDTREHCVYDLQGQASQLAIGALLESISIAASAFSCWAEFSVRNGMPENKPTIDVRLKEDLSLKANSLFSCLSVRSVHRRRYKTIPLDDVQKRLLEQSVGDNYTVKWVDGWADRFKAATLMFKNGRLRLTMPEAYPTHSTIIEWNSQYSEDKIPDQAIGLDMMATKLMKWALKSWSRVNFLNNFAFGTLLPRIELDLIPGFFCAAHFALISKDEVVGLEGNLGAGRAIQRFWLTATQLGLQLQPEMTPLIFSGYVRKKIKFTKQARLNDYAEGLSLKLENLLGKSEAKSAVFLGRIGLASPSCARSLRMPLSKLIVDNK